MTQTVTTPLNDNLDFGDPRRGPEAAHLLFGVSRGSRTLERDGMRGLGAPLRRGKAQRPGVRVRRGRLQGGYCCEFGGFIEIFNK